MALAGGKVGRSSKDRGGGEEPLIAQMQLRYQPEVTPLDDLNIESKFKLKKSSS